jgi:hypothetical protein
MLFLFVSLSVFSQREGDCLCYQDEVLEADGVVRVMVSPATTQIRVVPPVTTTVRDSILIRPSTPVIRDTGCVDCWVDSPSQYSYFNRVEVITGATTETIQVPAKYSEFPKMKIKYPARTFWTASGSCTGRVIR